MRICEGIACFFDGIITAKNLCFIRCQHTIDLRFLPHVERTLNFISLLFGVNTVGVFRRIESSLRRGHIPQNVFQCFARNGCKKFIVSELICIEVRIDQLCLVIQHLFKMWNAPLSINGIAVESAAEMVIHSAACHRHQRCQGHLQRVLILCAVVVPKQEIENDRTGKLCSASESGIFWIISCRQLMVRAFQNCFIYFRIAAVNTMAMLQLFNQFFAGADYIFAFFLPYVIDPLQQ